MKILKAVFLVYIVACTITFTWHLLKPKKYYTIPIRRRDDGENS